jgi:GNAT superfamily N-acetyltransferase
MRVEPMQAAQMPQLAALVNLHLATVLPGWTLPEVDIAEHLQRDRGQTITDPWVAHRATLCVASDYQMLAAAHLLSYRGDPDVNQPYRGIGEIGWLLFVPGHDDAAAAVLAAAHEQLADWGAHPDYGWGQGLPAGPVWGIPHCWPHIRAALVTAGYRPDPTAHREVLYGGWLAGVPVPGTAPSAGLTLQRALGPEGTRFAALHEGQEVGYCECVPGLQRGGRWPGQPGWGEVWELDVQEGRRRQGIGSWLVGHAVAWLRLAGCDRVVISMTEDDETAGAGQFFGRFGWEALVREVHGWTRAMADPAARAAGG